MVAPLLTSVYFARAAGAKNWAYDALNRVTIAQDAERYQTIYDYDKVGNRTGETWPNVR